MANLFNEMLPGVFHVWVPIIFVPCMGTWVICYPWGISAALPLLVNGFFNGIHINMTSVVIILWFYDRQIYIPDPQSSLGRQESVFILQTFKGRFEQGHLLSVWECPSSSQNLRSRFSSSTALKIWKLWTKKKSNVASKLFHSHGRMLSIRTRLSISDFQPSCGNIKGMFRASRHNT